LVAILFVNLSHSQIQIQVSEKYHEYFSEINKGKSKIVDKELDASLVIYESVLYKFNYPFYKHIKQATLVSLYANNESKFKFFLQKSITKGMTKNEFSFFEKQHKFKSVVKETARLYDSLYSCYSVGVDSSILIPYQKLDAKDFFIHSYLLGYSNDSLKDAFHNEIQPNLIDKYLNLIDEVGYPSEKNVGISKASNYQLKSPKVKPGYNTLYLSDSLQLYKEQYKGYYIVTKANPDYLLYSHLPGNWLLWHNSINVCIDTVMQAKIIEGVMNLELPPVFLTQMFENSYNDDSDFFSSDKDYATTYNSYTLREIAKTAFGMYTRLDKYEINKIDSLRRYILIPTLKDEKTLILELYYLKTGKQKSILTNKIISKVKYEYEAFISYYRL